MKRVITTLLFLFLLGYLSLIVWANRALYTSTFDASYWEDRFLHSQWSLPASERTIGDDGLYLHQGYQLVHGADPTSHNPEVPPLGKYLIGMSVQIFGNGYWYGFIMMSASLLIIFFIVYTLTTNLLISLMTTIAVAADPLITSQFTLTMVDSAQLFFLLFTLLCITLYSKTTHSTRKILFVCAGGITLGLFSVVKFPIFSPFLFILCVWRMRHHIFHILVFLTTAIIGYSIPYIPYFFMGHSLLDFLRLQKYIVTFYQSGYAAKNIGSAVSTLFAGRYQNLFTHTWTTVSQWSPIWPLITVANIMATPSVLVVGIMACIMIITYTILPFWTRYLVILLPLLYISTFVWLHNIHKKSTPLLLALCILINFVSAHHVLFPTPHDAVREFTYAWSHGYFHDMYEQLSLSSKKLSRSEFHRFGQKAFYDAHIEHVQISVPTNAWTRDAQQTIPLTIVYTTRHLGQFSHSVSLPLVRENNRWHIVWNWSLLFPEFSETSHLKTTVDPAKRGSIFEHNQALAYDKQSFAIWITPKEVETSREQEMLHLLETLFEKRIEGVDIHNRYTENSQSDWPTLIGIPIKPIKENDIIMLRSYPGISLTPALGRFTTLPERADVGHVSNTLFLECCSLLYNTTTYDGIDGLEKQFNDVLKGYNGGTLEIVDTKGNLVRTLIQIEKKEGKDVTAP